MANIQFTKEAESFPVYFGCADNNFRYERESGGIKPLEEQVKESILKDKVWYSKLFLSPFLKEEKNSFPLETMGSVLVVHFSYHRFYR